MLLCFKGVFNLPINVFLICVFKILLNSSLKKLLELVLLNSFVSLNKCEELTHYLLQTMQASQAKGEMLSSLEDHTSYIW